MVVVTSDNPVPSQTPTKSLNIKGAAFFYACCLKDSSGFKKFSLVIDVSVWLYCTVVRVMRLMVKLVMSTCKLVLKSAILAIHHTKRNSNKTLTYTHILLFCYVEVFICHYNVVTSQKLHLIVIYFI